MRYKLYIWVNQGWLLFLTPVWYLEPINTRRNLREKGYCTALERLYENIY